MRTVALIVAFFFVAVGAVGLLSPDTLMTFKDYVGTPFGLAAIGTLRIGIGLVLVLVAPVSRAPRTVRVVGMLVIGVGLATYFFGVQRTRAVLEYEATLGPAFFRGAAAVLMALGGLMVFAVRPPSLSPKP
jgi:hypothetical protein